MVTVLISHLILMSHHCSITASKADVPPSQSEKADTSVGLSHLFSGSTSYFSRPCSDRTRGNGFKL